MNEYLSPNMEMDFEAARSVTRLYARTFYFSSHVLPKEKRKAAFAIYGFCRLADEVVDNVSASTGHREVHERLNELQKLLDDVYNTAKSTHLTAFRQTVHKYQIPREYFNDLLEGIEMDIHVSRLSNFTELKRYCYCVASVVGLMMTRVFGVSDDSAYTYAESLGIAMQLTNILRDVGEDLHRGRIYLPLDELEQFGCSEETLTGGVVTDEFKQLMKFQIERARVFYDMADKGIPLVTDDGSRFCVKLMRHAYSQILNRIEMNQYDVFNKRAYVPFHVKLKIAVSHYFG